MYAYVHVQYTSIVCAVRTYVHIYCVCCTYICTHLLCVLYVRMYTSIVCTVRTVCTHLLCVLYVCMYTSIVCTVRMYVHIYCVCCMYVCTHLLCVLYVCTYVHACISTIVCLSYHSRQYMSSLPTSTSTSHSTVCDNRQGIVPDPTTHQQSEGVWECLSTR